MTNAQLKETPAPDSRESLIFGICDRLHDHGHCVADVVLAPAKADGEPDWDSAGPANVESLPADVWPADEKAALRASVIVDHIDGCDEATSMLLFLREDGQPSMVQIAGPEADGDIAVRIIGRDIGAQPPERAPTPLQESMAKLRAELFPPRPAPVAANDNVPQGTLTFVNPATWHGKPIPARQWYAPDLIPLRQVTILNGDGGVGKSLLALQIAAAGAMSVDTLDMSLWSGRTLYIGAEDEAEEFHRRLADIAVAHGKKLDQLSAFRLLPLADQDALLAVPDRGGNMKPTALWAKIVEFVCEFEPRLVVLDTAADLFGGDEIKRGQVRQFIGMLRQLAIGLDCAVILLAHPSVQGMQSGTGSSGSTAWNNSVRSRLYLTADKQDPDLRILKTMKINYGKTGGEIRLRWKAGAFVLDDGKPSAGSMLLAARAESVFLDLLSSINRSGMRVSAAKSSTYAPSVMADMPGAEGLNRKILEVAMRALLANGQIKVVMEGPASKQRQRLIVSTEDFGPSD